MEEDKEFLDLGLRDYAGIFFHLISFYTVLAINSVPISHAVDAGGEGGNMSLLGGNILDIEVEGQNELDRRKSAILVQQINDKC